MAYTTKITNTIINNEWRAYFSPRCDKCWVGRRETAFSVQDKFITTHIDANKCTSVYDSEGNYLYGIVGTLCCFCRPDIWVFYAEGAEIKVKHQNNKIETTTAGNVYYVDMVGFKVIDKIINRQFITWLGDKNAVEMDLRGAVHTDCDNSVYYTQTKYITYFRSFEKQNQEPKNIANLEKENNKIKEELAETKSELEKIRQKIADYAKLEKSFEQIKNLLGGLPGN